MPDRTPMLALWLDSADDALLRNWMAEGRLPTFQRLFQSGFSGTLANPCHSLAEIAQALLITGCPPETSRYWGVHHFDPQAYTVTHGGIYDYHTRPPFFAVGPSHRIAAIDLPQYHFHPAVHGWQVRNWGCHSAMTPTDSLPPEAIGILDREAGIPPIRTHNFSNLKDAQDLKRLVDDLHQALDARARMLAFLIGQGGWDLVLTPFAELHKGGHYLVPNPDSLDILGRDDPWAPLRGLYEHLDRILAGLLERANGWNVAVFSIEGVHTYSDEPHNTFLLGDFLLRDSFGGRGAFVYEDPTRGPSPEARAGKHNWVMEAWHQRRRTGRLQRGLNRTLGTRTAAALEARLGLPLHPEKPVQGTHCDYQPLMWIRKYWPHMRAFALPTFSDGQIRLNVRGREARGFIAPGDYDAECGRLTEALLRLRHTASGLPAIRRVLRTRRDAFQSGNDLPPADLVVQWTDPGGANCVDSPALGRLGPVDSLRGSAHSPVGFFAACGPRIPAGTVPAGSTIFDIAPTLLDLIGAQPPAPLPGRSLLVGAATPAPSACT